MLEGWRGKARTEEAASLKNKCVLSNWMPILLAILVCATAACGTLGPLRVESHAAPGEDLARFRTYDWAAPPLPASPRRRDDPAVALDWRVRNAIDRELSGKGFARRAADAPADFVVDYDMTVTQKHTDTIGDLVHYRAAGGSKDPGVSYVEGYHEGTLRLDVIDARTGQLAWHASARAILDEDDPHRQVEDAVRAMLARFPSR